MAEFVKFLFIIWYLLFMMIWWPIKGVYLLIRFLIRENQAQQISGEAKAGNYAAQQAYQSQPSRGNTLYYKEPMDDGSKQPDE